MPGPYDTSPLGTGKNWVTKAGGLPPFVRAVAHALIRQGHTESEAIQIAIGVMKRAIASGKWASLKGHASAKTVGKSGASIAHWEAMKAKADLSGGDAMTIDLGSAVSVQDGPKVTVNSITAGACVYNPQGDELDQVQRQLKGITALKKSGRTKQAQSAVDALVKAKTSRARKMRDGTTRAHTPMEVRAGLSRIGNVDLSGGSMSTIDLAGDLASRMFPDAASLKKAAGKLANMPKALQPRMKSMIMQRAKALGVEVNLAHELRTQRLVDLAVKEVMRSEA